MELSDKLVLALPKGRILGEVMPLVRAAGIEPEADFDDPKSRKLEFDTNIKNLTIIRVRAFDAATFIAFGAAHMGVVGNDVLQEFGYSDLYSPLDLDIGHCRLSLAMPVETKSTMRLERPRRGASSIAPFSLIHSACTPRSA